MVRESALSRRTLVKVTGAAAATGLIAGCTNGGGNGNGDPSDDVDPAEWEDVDTLEFVGETGGWEGVAPSMIEGEVNPTIALFAGRDYTYTWENGDGSGHNIELRNDGGDVVDDYSTEVMNNQGETQSLEFTASTEMTTYVCRPHENSMIGDIVVEEE